MFGPGNTFQPSLILASKASIVNPYKGAAAHNTLAGGGVSKELLLMGKIQYVD